MAFGYRRQPFFKDFHGLLHFLRRSLLRYQQRVFGIDGDDVFTIDENDGLQRFVGMGEISGLSDFEDLGFGTFAVGEFFQRIETSEIRPSYVYAKNAHVLSFFKKPVVDGEVWKGIENLLDRIVFRKSREIGRIGLFKFVVEGFF